MRVPSALRFASSSAIAIAALSACAAVGTPRRDAAGGPPPDGGMPGVDAWAPGIDAWSPPGVDAWAPDRDAWTAPPDAFVPGPGAYLDRCTTGADCMTGLCERDVGGTHFCSRTCTSDLQCAQEHVCVPGTPYSVCRPDDTGAPCSVGSPELCTLGLCLGGTGGGHCTRPCSTAADCPSGYACTHAGGSTMTICVDIEEPCASAAECGTGLCVDPVGCTAECRTPADCPARLPGLPAYACNTSLGTTTPLCIPPADIAGDDPIGAGCSATGMNTCRSDVCDTSAPLGPMCTQTCTANGGCGPGLGCYPVVDTGMVYMLCSRAGSGDLGTSCSAGSACHSGLCDSTGFYCTRLCADGLCPTGWHCETVAGLGVSICRH